LLQYLPSIYEDYIDANVFKSDFDLAFFSKRKMLLVEVDRETREERMRERGRFLRQQLPELERHEYAKIFEHNFSLISEVLAKNFDVTVIKN